MSANERQIGGNHYKKEGRVEHWDIVVQWELDYFQGQITKYVMRWRDKGGLQDLEKARHFIDKYIEVEAARQYEGLCAQAGEPEGAYVNQDRTAKAPEGAGVLGKRLRPVRRR